MECLGKVIVDLFQIFMWRNMSSFQSPKNKAFFLAFIVWIFFFNFRFDFKEGLDVCIEYTERLPIKPFLVDAGTFPVDMLIQNELWGSGAGRGVSTRSGTSSVSRLILTFPADQL